MPDLFVEGKIKEGFVDYGYSSAAGIASTVRDLAVFSRALDKNLLITEKSKLNMITPAKPNLPYAYGIFNQYFNGHRLIWGYGQYDCYSSLFLKVPDKKLTFIIAANNNLMSDPARLIYGDVTCSLFALSFLKNYVLNLNNIPLLEDERSLPAVPNRITTANSTFYQRKLLAQSLAECFFGVFDSSGAINSRAMLDMVFKLYPDYTLYADLNLLHNLSMLKQILTPVNGMKGFIGFDPHIKKIAEKLLSIDNDNPYANCYLARYYRINGPRDSATRYYKHIITASNFAKNWYTNEAEEWIKENSK